MTSAIERLRSPATTAIETGDVPGVVALVWQGGRIVDLHAAGLADTLTRRPMQREAIFPIASMSKPVTVAVALRLMEQGRLRLEDPITRWAPEFADMRVLKRPDGPLDETYPAPRAITVEDLMTHRSGLTYGFTSRGPLAGELMRTFGFGIDSAMDPDAWMKTLAALPLACAPGERFEYGHSIDVLGFILGRAAGCSLQEVMRQALFEPLGMADTGFWAPPDKRERFVANVQSPSAGEFTPAPIAWFTAPQPGAYASGGQGLVSTADDFLAFARTLARGGESERGRLLKPETVRLMTANRLTAAQRQMTFMGMPLFAARGFGLGVSVVMDAQANAMMGAGEVGAFGWPGGFGGWWQADPARDAVLIWLQACTPPPPQAGAPPRMPGARAVIDFQRAAYQALS
ncbi:MAG TPA: serine hydrolase domain-containing protein [Caulobacteraceae bacterium]